MTCSVLNSYVEWWAYDLKLNAVSHLSQIQFIEKCLQIANSLLGPNFFVEILLIQTFALQLDLHLRFVHEVELLQRKFIKFIFQFPYVHLLDLAHRFRLRFDFRCRLAQMRFARIQILVHWSGEYSKSNRRKLHWVDCVRDDNSESIRIYLGNDSSSK